jgi:hypothetical protein
VIAAHSRVTIMSNNIESKVVVITGAAMSQPDDVDINEILFRPTKQEL